MLKPMSASLNLITQKGRGDCAQTPKRIIVNVLVARNFDCRGIDLGLHEARFFVSTDWDFSQRGLYANPDFGFPILYAKSIS